MKKLFKEVWKSFAKSKVILAGLIVLIFLTSGIVTLIFDVVNSYKTQFNNFKSQSVLQDITMNTNLNLYGEKPQTLYSSKNESKYKNSDNLLDNQWEYIETNNYIDSINVNTKSEYFNLKNVVENFSSDIYVKTKDLSYLMNSNYNINPNSVTDTNNNKKIITLSSNGNNNIAMYRKEGDSFVPLAVETVSQVDQINDTYDSATKQWISSFNVKNLYSNNKFEQLVIYKPTQQTFILSKLTQSNSEIAQLYATQPWLFYTISSDDVAELLGFKKTGIIFTSWSLDTSSTWILDADIKTFKNGISPKQFFAQANLPSILPNFKLKKEITNFNSLTLSKLIIPNTWFVYSKYRYIFTNKESYLSGISPNNEIDKNIWSGYYYDYLNNLKLNNQEEFNKLTKVNYWTKDVYVTKVDGNGNEVQLIDENGNLIENSKIESQFNVALSLSDLTIDIKNNKGEISTLQTITGKNVNEETVSELSTNLESYNEGKIDEESKQFQYQNFYDAMMKLVDQVGIRETVTVNSNNDSNGTNVYQFINLGNEKNELDWNGIKVKQNVGKLIETNTSHDIFSLPSNINSSSKMVPQEYVAPIIEQFLKGLSPNRNYINPMISFGSFDYQENGVTNTISSVKIVWMTQNGAADKSNIYGIASNKKGKYFVLKSDLNTQANVWTTLSGKEQGFTLDELKLYISNNNLNFAPFDLNGNEIQVVGENGWARQDTTYADKYSVPFQYLLPDSTIINDYNDALQNPDSGKYGLEKFKEQMIYTMTLTIKPLMSASTWETLCQAVNTAFSRYGFADGLTPPAAISKETIVKIMIGTFRDAAVASNEDFMGIFITNLLKGLKRYINPDGQRTKEEQKTTLQKELTKIFNVIKIASNPNFSEEAILAMINQALGQNFTQIIDLIDDPSVFLDSLIKMFASINLDQSVIDIWNNYTNPNRKPRQTIGTGDIVPYIYKNIYDTTSFKNAFVSLLQSTNLLPSSISGLLNLIQMKSSQEGYEYLISNIEHKTNEQYNIEYDTISLQNILNVFSAPLIGNLGDFVATQTTLPSTDILYDPTEKLYLELDMDLLWYLKNYAFIDPETNKSLEIFGVDVNSFLQSATNAFTEIKDDYNQVTMTENSGQIAIVNQAFLEQNKKEVYTSSTLNDDLSDISKISEKYKINVGGVEYVIVGQDFSVDYMYPVINAENTTVNTKTQALVYVNQNGFDRIRRSNTGSPYEKYFLITNKDGNNLSETQTKLNQLVYYYSTGQTIDASKANDAQFNPYKLAYLTNETSILNPERSLRITTIEQMITNLERIQLLVGSMLIVIVSIVIMFIVRRYIASRSKALGILKAQGYASWQIALSVCLFPWFVSIIGATLGYVVGLLSQYGIFKLFSIFWTLPIVTIPFNWMTFLVTLIAPIVLLSILTIITTYWFLARNKPMAMMNGSMEVNDTKFARSVQSLASKTSVKNKFSVSLALGSIGKLIALFISSVFTAGVTLFFITSYKCFNRSINSTYMNRNYTYISTYNTPTIEGGQIQTYYIQPNGANDINNMLYVPVGDPLEGSTYLANYFKPGYNQFMNKQLEVDGQLINANGNLSSTDTTTPHIFTKAAVDLTVDAGGISINVWKNLYNAIPESQRAMIISISEKANAWMEWAQEGQIYEYNGNQYITKFVKFGDENEYLSLWDTNTNDFVKVTTLDPETGNNKNENIRISYFNYVLNSENPEDSKFVFKEAKNNLEYFEYQLTITGKPSSNKIRAQYRDFLVFTYNLMLNYDETNPSKSKLNEDQRTLMPEYSMDYFISPSAMFLGYNDQTKSNDETFTYISAQDTNDVNLQPTIYGYKEDSKYVSIKDNGGNDLIKKANQFAQDNHDIYPLIINHVVARKYNLSQNDEIKLKVTNSYNRYENKLKEVLNANNSDSTFTFKIIGINETYVNEEWITSYNIANQILGLPDNSYNGIMSNNQSPVPISNVLPLYSYNGYWAGDNKIFSASSPTSLSYSEKNRLVNTYKQLFYNVSTNTGETENRSLMAMNIKRIYPNFTNEQINNKIKEFLGYSQDTSLEITGSESTLNDDAIKANNAIQKFMNLYGNDALTTSFNNAVSNGVEKEYIINASTTINDSMTLVIIVAFAISLTILIMITSMIINENERNIAIFGILGYTNKEKIRMFFSIYVPIVLLAILFSALIVWLVIPAFLSSILASTSIALSISLSFVQILIAFGIISFIFALTCMIAWFIQGRIKPIMLLKEV